MNLIEIFTKIPELGTIILMVALSPPLVSSLETDILNYKSQSVRQGVQKVASIFFGCNGLTPQTAKVLCTNKIEKITQGVACDIRVPWGTKATFSCRDNMTLSENYNTVQCKFPGKWVPVPPKCLSIDTDQNSTLHETEMTSTTVPTQNTTKALLLPIATKRYDNVGLLSLFESQMNFLDARALCAEATSKLMYFDSTASMNAALDLIGTTQFSTITINVGLEATRTPPSKKFYYSWGVEQSPPKWCGGDPSMKNTELCTCIAVVGGAPSQNCQGDLDCSNNIHVMCRAP